MKLGIIRTSSIGDVVLSTVAIDLIKKSCPEAEILWVGREPSLSLIVSNQKSVTPFNIASANSRTKKKELETLLKSCDAVVDLQVSLRSILLLLKLRFLGIKTFSAKKNKRLRSSMVLKSFLWGRFRVLKPQEIMPSFYQYQIMGDAVQRCLAFFRIKADQTSAPLLNQLPLSHEHKPWMRELALHQKWLAIAPGASHETKRAPAELFHDILKNFSQVDLKEIPSLVFLGSNEDLPASRQILDLIKWKTPVLNLTGKLTLDETAAVLSRVSALLCNDSGLSHIAESLNTPVAVLFGPTIESFGFAPRLKASQSFSSNIGCRPCSKHGKSTCRFGDKLCFWGISTKKVTDHLLLCMKKARSP